MDHTIRIGGEAGQGLQVIGSVLARLFSRYGLHVFTHQDYMSRIRGGHNYYQIRFADKPVLSSRDKIDILLALDLNTISIHQQTVKSKGIILYDADSLKRKFPGPQFINAPFAGITEELGIDIIMANSVAVGAVLGILNIGLDLFEETIAAFLHGKGEAVVATNKDAAQAGFDFVQKEYKDIDDFRVKVEQRQGLLLINGSMAIGLGALLSGCKFYAAYPMTPSTGIMNYLASKSAEYNIVVEQAEDEISAINMALGASYGGVRAMTGTSGGGFALMTEGVSLAGMTETPVVIAEVQRPGPATGLPTRTEQSDLFFVLHGGHGEFPRVVFTPGTPEQALYLTNKAFHLAEKYQIPVFILSDQYLADSEWTYVGLNTDRLLYEDFRLRKEDLKDLQIYHRYALTDNGISPLAVPGESKHTVVVDSDEHDEQGHIIEDAQTRIQMVEKRLHKKLLLIRQEIEPPLFHGPEQPKVILVGFGSTYGVLKEAVNFLSDHYRIGMLHFSEIFPFPLLEKFDFLSLLEQAALTICVENNATSQFARLMRAETGFTFQEEINKYDGRPFTLDSLLGELNGYLRGL
jgi:2-oxoglutarate ferredoxin oxidoreductase subunit alpha